MTCGFLIQLVFLINNDFLKRKLLTLTGILQKKTMWFIGVEVEQETSAHPPKKNPGSAPAHSLEETFILYLLVALFSICRFITWFSVLPYQK